MVLWSTWGHPSHKFFTNTKKRKDKNRKRDNHKVKKFPTKVEESLTGRVIAAHGDIVRKLHNVEEAQRARDAFTKVGKLDQENTKKGAFCVEIFVKSSFKQIEIHRSDE